MPAIAKTEQFVELVRKSRLVDERKLSDFLQRHQDLLGDDSPVPLATKMVQEAVLTTFQAKQLLQGKWRRFIINNKYKVLELLGQGGMGSVYLCEQFLMRRLVALKMLPEEKLQQPGALERFMREARAVATLDHPNIVHAYDMDRDEHGMHFMVMEYVDGVSLEVLVSKLYKNKGLEPIRAAHYIAQAALGLQHAHELGWVHRDIKPANLLLDRQGVIKILDMGLSRAFGGEDEELTKKYDGSSVLGTADYIAPEQALHVSEVDIRADIYSLGATFYFLLTGRAPFEKATVTQKLMFHQMKDPDPVSQVRPEVPVEMSQIVATMMAKNPNERFQVPAEIVEALAPWTATPIPAPPEREMPALCPLVRELSPTTAVSKSSSGSYPSRVLSTAFGSPGSSGIRTPLTGVGSSGIRTPLTGSGRMVVPTNPTQVETVSDSGERRRAMTPKSLPRVAQQPHEVEARKPVKQQQISPKLLALAAVGFLAVVIGLIALIMIVAFSDKPKAVELVGTDSQLQGIDITAEPTITPIQARNHIGRKAFVEFVVRAVSVLKGGRGDIQFYFLYSEPFERRDDYDNFLLVIPAAVQPRVLEEMKLTELEDLIDCKVKAHGTVQWWTVTGTRRAHIEMVHVSQLTLVSGTPTSRSSVITVAQAADRVGQTAAVEFTVGNVERVGSVSRVYLMSTKAGEPRQFAAALREDLEQKICDRLGVTSLEELEGKRLVVRGKVDTFEGKPFIEVTDPTQLRVSKRPASAANGASPSDTNPPPATPPPPPTVGSVITPEEALKQVGQEVVVEFVVGSTGRSNSGTRLFLNSQPDYKRPDNFPIVLPAGVENQLCKKLGVQVFEELRGKKIRVRGRVTTFQERPQIELFDISGLELASN
jgi:serine/threonine protein kinase